VAGAVPVPFLKSELKKTGREGPLFSSWEHLNFSTAAFVNLDLGELRGGFAFGAVIVG